MTSRILPPLMFLALAAALAPAGTLTTRDGKTYTGGLQLGATDITVNTDAGPRSFPLASVAAADFKAGAAALKAGHGLRGEYFAGRNLKKLLLTRVDPAIDYDWRETVPHPSLVPWAREFSVRWTGRLRPDRTDAYTIISNSDDGCRVWLDGKLIIDEWHDQMGADCTAKVALEKDRDYDLKVEFYNGPDQALAKLHWASASLPRQIIPAENLYLPKAGQGGGSAAASAVTSGGVTTTQNSVTLQTPGTDGGPPFERVLQTDATGLKGEYYADRELEHLNFVRFDPNIDFHFHPDNPPDPAMSPEGSIRWTGMLEPRYTETYRFHVEVHRRIRLWVDGNLVIDQWRGEGGEYGSDKIPLTAGRRVPFKVEYTSPNGFMLCRVRWSSKSQPRDTIPPDAFSVAPGEKLGRPVVGLLYPAGETFVAAPASLQLLAAGFTPNGAITKVAFYDRNAPIADAEAAPWQYDWKRPAPGVYRLRAKLTDAAGVTALSESFGLTVTGKGDGSVKAPWGDFFIANNDCKTPGTANQSGETFKIDNAVGTLVSESEHDAGHFVVQPLGGDGQIIARMVGVKPGPDDGGQAGAMGGVTIRETLKNRCKQFSMLYGHSGEEPVAAFVRRQDHWMNPAVNEKPMKIPERGAAGGGAAGEGVWFKLARHGQRLYAYTGTDGKTWDLFASERFETGPQVFAGLVAFSRDANKPASARFDHVQLIPGAPPLESLAKGFVTRGGTLVAADVWSVDGDAVRYGRNNAAGSIPVREVARILYKPLLADHANTLSPGRTGVLMSTGDFLEGDVRSVKEGNVNVSSVLFGVRQVRLWDDVTAIILHDVAPEKTPFTLTTTDGSFYRPKTLKPDPQNLQIDDASLGPVSIPLGTLVQLRGQ